MDMASLTKQIKSPTTLFVVAALAVGAVGSKMFWADSPSMAKAAPIATMKSAPGEKSSQRATGAVVAGAKMQSAVRAGASAKAQAAVVAAPKAVAQIENEAPQVAHAAPQVSQQSASDEDEASVAAPKIVRTSVAGSKRTQPTEIDNSSDTEGLFAISAMKPSHPAQSVAAASGANEVNQVSNANTTVNASVSDVMNSALGERVISTNSAQAPGPVTDGLGPVFVDDSNGYYMRFPAAWSIRKFDGEPWVVECGDGKTALISVGFSAFPAEYTADDINLDWVARRVKKRSETTLNAQGFATIMNRKAVWSKSTGPMQLSGSTVKVVRTTYILPLGDGRVAEIRIAASPEQYEKIAGVMKNAVSTFRIVPKRPETSVARTE